MRAIPRHCAAIVLAALLMTRPCPLLIAAEPELAEWQREFSTTVTPIVKKFCVECHSEKKPEGEINLEAVSRFDEALKQPRLWEKVADMLHTRQMPPPEVKQPSEAEVSQLQKEVRRLLNREARRNAGDPGPVPLRRLNNAEYTYLVRDLTNVDSLNPAREFPVDGAAGEGFTNAASGLAMSPALITKYIDAGKEIAAHAVLLPDGIRFSPFTTRRDQTEELLAEIRKLHAKYCDSTAGTQVNLQGVIFQTNGGGRLPIERYLAATLAERQAIRDGKRTLEEIAQERQLSSKYLRKLWESLDSQPVAPADASPIFAALKSRWNSAEPSDVASLVEEISHWQRALWRFTSVGHIGKEGGPKRWMEPVSPLLARQEIRVKIPPSKPGQSLKLTIHVGDAGDGNDHDFVVLERPRFVGPNRPDVLLKDLRPLVGQLTARRTLLAKQAADCLAAAAEIEALSKEKSTALDLQDIANRHHIDRDLLQAWLDYLGISSVGPLKLSLIEKKTESAGNHDFIKGWVGNDALSVLANSSDQTVRIPGLMSPRGIAVHPAPKFSVAVGWRAPFAATVNVAGFIKHAHPECGNGVNWSVELRRGNTRQVLASGTSNRATPVPFGPLENLAVLEGDLISLIINPMDGNHSCDLTAIDLTLKNAQHEWSLAKEISPEILAGNPHADSAGRSNVWHFYFEPATGTTGSTIPAGSLLARWRATSAQDERAQLAQRIQELLQLPVEKVPGNSPDGSLYQQLTALGGPLLSMRHSSSATNSERAETVFGLARDRFGRHPNGGAIDGQSLCVKAPATIEIPLPDDLLAGTEFLVTGWLHAETANEGTVQLQGELADTTAANRSRTGLLSGVPIVIVPESPRFHRWEAACHEFRECFPPALCYSKIVPVDEVVTLTLFHREDEVLQKLMLNDAEIARLDRLWQELHFVSQDALTLVDAFEQLWQYATQDANPKVFEPLRKPITQRAEDFRRTLLAAEPAHLDGVIRFAAMAFRRPLSRGEESEFRGLYRKLREQELSHEDSIRLLIGRIFVSPAFLYRMEQSPRTDRVAANTAPNGPKPDFLAAPISDRELAIRLSFFLWSTAPDTELFAAVENGSLRKNGELLAQTQRMRMDARIQRLATEFGTQWLHVYQFDTHDEKSEAAFPTFSALRQPMYEEAIRVMTDLFQRDGSILELLDSDRTFVNGPLAKHYGLSNVSSDEWRSVEGIRQHGRGGVLGFAATLSKQAGASRTSPILRGNWVSEVLLGEKLPRPPKGVPVLPETVPAGLTERQLIEQHSSVAACAKCHARIDPLGFSLEGYDAIGRRRGADAAGQKIDTRTKLMDGTPIEGLEGLRNYLLGERREDFVRQYCRKMLGYALGRAVQLSDEPWLDETMSRLKAENYRVGRLMEAVVQSPQFQTIRVGESGEPKNP